MSDHEITYSQRRISKRVSAHNSSSYKTAWKELAKAKEAVKEAEKELEKVAMTLSGVVNIKAVAASEGFEVKEYTPSSVHLLFIVLDAEIKKPEPKAKLSTASEPAKPAPFKVPGHIDEKTVRMLLNGDMLDNKQKKKLIDGMIPGLLE